MPEKSSRGKNLRRREFLKYGTRVAAGAAVWGGAGYLAGLGVDKAIELYSVGLRETGQKLADLDERVRNMKGPLAPVVQTPMKIEEKRTGFYQKVFGRSEKDQEEWRKKHGIKTAKDKEQEENPVYEVPTPQPTQETVQEQTTRRGFLKRVLGYSIDHPRAVGAATGALYGGTKSAVTGVGKLKSNLRTAKQNERIAELENELRERIAHDEAERERLEGEIASFRTKLNDYENQSAGDKKSHAKDIAGLRTKMAGALVRYRELKRDYASLSEEVARYHAMQEKQPIKEGDLEKKVDRADEEPNSPGLMILGGVLIASSIIISAQGNFIERTISLSPQSRAIPMILGVAGAIMFFLGLTKILKFKYLKE